MHCIKMYFGIFLLPALIMFSCASKKDATGDHEHDHRGGDESVWKDMDDFHMIMAETFHPYKDSANLEPVKSRASELMTAADEWASAPLPEKVDNAEMRSRLRQLKAQATTLAVSVRSENDNVIAEQLNDLHDTFHAIQEGWYEQN